VQAQNVAEGRSHTTCGDLPVRSVLGVRYDQHLATEEESEMEKDVEVRVGKPKDDGNKHAVVLLSGGMDSAVLLADCVSHGMEVTALSINYGQRHMKELVAAKTLAQYYQVEHEIIMVPSGILENLTSSQSGNAEVPEGHYAAENMKTTVVPNRNMFLISVAVARGIALKADLVMYAAHAGDHAVYPDCRAEFVDAMASAVELCDWSPPRLAAPFLRLSKANIVALGFRLNVPFGATWTCYAGRRHACGRCGTCVERLEAFDQVMTVDPLEYEDRAFWKTAVKHAR